MKKKILSFAFSFVLALALVPSFTVPAHAATWQEAYARQLKNPGNATHFALLDIGDSTTQELLLFEDIQYGGAFLSSIYSFTTQLIPLSFADAGYEFYHIPVNSGQSGLFASWLSGNGRSGETYFLTLESGKIKNTLVYAFYLGNIGFGGNEEGAEETHNQSLYDLYTDSQELTLYQITESNIRKYITDATVTNPASPISTPHPFATALAEYFKDATRYSSASAYLVDLDGDNINELFAEKLWSKDDGSCQYTIFYFVNASLKSLKIEEYAWLSSTGYILSNPVDNVILVHRFFNGELQNVDYSHSDRSIYGLDDDSSTNIPDQSALILAMTAEPSAKTVTPTASSIFVNGLKTDFEAYNIDGYNFFKLRDLAAVLSGTQKQFDVAYDDSSRAITLSTGKPYTFVGGELMSGDGNPKSAAPTASKIFLDGRELSFSVFNINGNNFFKLRDLMQVIDVFVGYDNATKNITLDTAYAYVSE